MKKCLLILLCILTMQGNDILMAQQDTILVFAGSLDTSPTSLPTMKPCLSRTERSSSDFGGVIEVKFGTGISEEMQYCIKAAAKLWEEKLYIPKKVILKFEKERMGTEAPDFKAQVVYTLLSGEKKMYPRSYFANFLTDDARQDEVDAIIQINEDVDWDYGFSEEVVNKKNLTTAMLRAIAMTFGFGSSVVDNLAKGIVFSVRRCFSPFDNLIINSNNVCLNEMPNNGRTSQELMSFVTGDNVYYKTPNAESLKLYASPDFQGYNYLSYFDTEGELMSYNMRVGDKNQQIDRKTQEVLEAIGWKEPKNSLRIVATDIDHTGMASALRGYSFHAEIASGNITKYSWKYELLNNKMDYDSIKVGNSPIFEIDKISELSKYNIDINGDIRGRVSLKAMVNGKEMTKILYVRFATKPTFISVKVDAITPIPGTKYYNLDITVVYTGADFLYAEQTEEISSIGITTYVYEPYIAHLHFKNIYKIGMAWVDLTLKNQIGEAFYTVEIPSQEGLAEKYQPCGYLAPNIGIMHVIVRDMQGRQVLQADNNDEIENLSRGIYTLTITYADGRIETKKICK